MNAYPKIKICGITTADDARFLNEFQIQYAGFVLYKKSKRYIEETKIKEIFHILNKDIIKNAVLVSPKPEEIQEIQQMEFDILQIHGKLEESVLEQATLPIWYAVNISDTMELQAKLQFLAELPEHLRRKVTGIVVDGAGYGGGVPFSWQRDPMLKTLKKRYQFILAGGLDAQNVRNGIEVFEPDVVDVSTGVETTNFQNGICGKSREKIEEFTRKVRSYE